MKNYVKSYSYYDGCERPSPRDAPAMVGRRAEPSDERKPAYVNHLAVKHRVWYGDSPAMVGRRQQADGQDSPLLTKEKNSASPKAVRPGRKKQHMRCVQLSKKQANVYSIPEQLLSSLKEEDQLELSKVRRRLRHWLKTSNLRKYGPQQLQMVQTRCHKPDGTVEVSDGPNQMLVPGPGFVTLEEVERELYNNEDGISPERFHKVAEEELMALIATSEGMQRTQFQLAYTQWNREKTLSRQREERTHFKTYLQRQEDDIMRRKEKVTVVEEATGEYLDGIMKRKSRKFWPTSCFFREMNMRVKKKLMRQKFSVIRPDKSTKIDSTFSEF